MAAVAVSGLLFAPEGRAEPAPRGRGGRPEVRLDRLEFPTTVAAWWLHKKHLRQTLKRESRRLDWGAGAGAKIVYRFRVEELDVVEQEGVVHVSCTARGRLPKGKAARSRLTFSGAAAQRGKVIRTVLDVVARGVLTRLAEMERIRRGDLEPSTGGPRP